VAVGLAWLHWHLERPVDESPAFLANVRRRLGDYPEAERMYSQALDVCRGKPKAVVKLARAQCGLADVYEYQAKYKTVEAL
jgi:thioredoxin-like negative regulator of GroEL